MEQIWSKFPTFAIVIITPYHTDDYDNTISYPHFRKVQADRFGIQGATVATLQGRHIHRQVPCHEDLGQSQSLGQQEPANQKSHGLR